MKRLYSVLFLWVFLFSSTGLARLSDSESSTLGSKGQAPTHSDFPREEKLVWDSESNSCTNERGAPRSAKACKIQLAEKGWPSGPADAAKRYLSTGKSRVKIFYIEMVPVPGPEPGQIKFVPVNVGTQITM